ncbi:GNAT family N-acetyltransferase [Thalassobacillus sp. CUG 92003]|uniref:GNAT family N-acetyltransferase n=1 Tax=Thalassobacillus sp. CUG 92003 TaxID=2736641 RepID=UPI0015E68CC2|nr:GNAT family N-acetyltransferase [Thalassobacillus sp. CUG 92003]
MQIKELEVKELRQVSQWLYGMNGQDRHFVAWLASDENEIYEQIWTLTQFKEPLAYVAWENNEIIGFLGILPFFEHKLCRLLGPFAIKHEAEVLEGLWNKASLTIEMYFNAVKVACFQVNQELIDFCEQHAFHLYNTEKTLIQWRDTFQPMHVDASSIVEATPEDQAAIAALHPDGAYYTAAEMFELKHQAGNYLWGYQQNGEIAGYLYFETILPEEEGEICFVNVAPSDRGEGVGTALIEHALQYAFHALNLNSVTISVRTANQDAEHLYRQFGFEVWNVIHAYEKVFQEPIVRNTFH